MTEESNPEIIKDITRWYATENKNSGAVSGKFQVPDSLARLMEYKNKQKLIIEYNTETRETYIREI